MWETDRKRWRARAKIEAAPVRCTAVVFPARKGSCRSRQLKLIAENSYNDFMPSNFIFTVPHFHKTF